MSADAQAAVLHMPPLIGAAPELAALMPAIRRCGADSSFRAQFVTAKPWRATGERDLATRAAAGSKSKRENKRVAWL
jgi:hypothetical protein